MSRQTDVNILHPIPIDTCAIMTVKTLPCTHTEMLHFCNDFEFYVSTMSRQLTHFVQHSM